jgi:D-tagatose-1,6-bisphosphate aldolase subunit GatZ/KbaZ
VGTDLHTTLFDPAVASDLVREAAAYGSYIKGHYSDSVENPEAYPASGMGGANVGPEFTEAEFAALGDLVEAERELGLADHSDFMATLETAVVESGRWEKWRQPDEAGLAFNELDIERRQWLVRTGCRYIWTDPKVVSARAKLYANIEAGGRQAEQVVIDRIADSIGAYYRAFNLEGSNAEIEALLRAELING